MVVDHASGEPSVGISAIRSEARSTIRQVIVVGGGIAGLACALACAQAGVRVEVLESHASASGVPVHVDVVPNLLRDLARLGVAQACVLRGFAYSGLSVVDEHGTEGFRLPTQFLGGRRLPPAVGIALADLLDLLEGVAVQSGVTVHRGCTASAIDAECGRVVSDDGRVWIADLVIVAAGSESPLAAALLGPAPPGAMSHVWWHALLPRPTWLDRSTWMAGSLGRRLTLVPIGMSRAGVAVLADSQATAPIDAGALIRMLKSWGPLPRRIASTIDASAPIAQRRVAGVLRDGPWHRGAALCVGEAAYAVKPPFGQSTAQALEDAVVLGELVAAGLERPLLFQRFMKRRIERVRRLHALTEQGARWIARPEPSTDLVQLVDEINTLLMQPC